MKLSFPDLESVRYIPFINENHYKLYYLFNLLIIQQYYLNDKIGLRLWEATRNVHHGMNIF